LIKTRYQVATSGTVADAAASTITRSSDKEGINQIIRNVLRESGPKGFYAGFYPRLLASVPGSMIMMSVFEYLRPEKIGSDDA